MLLYDSPVSGNCYKVRLLLAHLGLPYERRTSTSSTARTGRSCSAALNPALRVPTLVLDDGRAARGVGRDPLVLRRGHALRARRIATSARRCCSGCSSSSTTTSRRSRSCASGSRTPGGPSSSRTGCEERDGGRLPRARRDGGHLAEREWFVGEAMTLADIALYAYTHVAHEGGFELERYRRSGVARARRRRAGARPDRRVDASRRREVTHLCTVVVSHDVHTFAALWSPA